MELRGRLEVLELQILEELQRHPSHDAAITAQRQSERVERAARELHCSEVAATEEDEDASEDEIFLHGQISRRRSRKAADRRTSTAAYAASTASEPVMVHQGRSLAARSTNTRYVQ